MKTFKEFTKEMQTEIFKYLPNDYTDSEAVIKPCYEPGRHYIGLCIASPNHNCSPILNLSDLYERAEQGESVKDLLMKYTKAFSYKLQIDLKQMLDYTSIKEWLFAKCIGIRGNEKFLQNVPHKVIEDLAIIYAAKIPIDMEDGDYSAVIRNNQFPDVGIDQLHEDAMRNSEKLFPAIIADIADINDCLFHAMSGTDPSPKSFNTALSEAWVTDCKLFVLTNKKNYYGATVLFYPGVMEALYKRLGTFYILPRSVHETQLIRSGQNEPSGLLEMVQYINTEAILPEERLADSVYQYDGLEFKKICLQS